MLLSLVLAAQLALTPETPISTPVIRSAPGTQTRPAIASNGTELFAAWEHRGDVIGSRIRPDGTAIDTNLGISLQPTWVYDMRPSVLWNGEAWVVVFFSGPQPWPYGAKAVEVNTDGVVITERVLVTPRDMTSIDVAWNGSMYLVAWRENPGPVRAQFFDRAFAKVGEELAIADDGAEVSVASGGGSFLVAWTSAAGTLARTVSGDGTLGSTAAVAGSSPDVDVAWNGVSYGVLAGDLVVLNASGGTTHRRTLEHPVTQTSIVADGANWIAVWGSGDQLFGGEFDAELRVVQEPSLVADTSSIQRFPAAGMIDGRALVVYSDFPSGEEWRSDIRSEFLGEAGVARLVSSGLMPQEIQDAAWSASTLGVVWFEGEGLAGEGLRFGELAPDGTLLHGEGIALANGLFPRIASNGMGFVVAAARNQQVEAEFFPEGRTIVLGGGTGPIAIASDGRDYYAVWKGVGGNTVGRRVGADGTLGELHTFREFQGPLISCSVQDLVWAGTKYVVLMYERVGVKIGTYVVLAAEVSAEGEAGPTFPMESGAAVYHQYQGRLAWNGEALLYARTNSTIGNGVHARLGLSGTDFIVYGDYADLQDVVWDRGEWLYLFSGYDGWQLLHGDQHIPFTSVLRPHLARGMRTAVFTTKLIERIPNHADQSVRRAFVTFATPNVRRRAVR